MNKQNATLKRAMLEALEKSLGIVTTAAKSAGIDRNTHYNWLKNDVEYAEAVRELANVSLDFAASNLFNQIKKGNTPATIFYLKARGGWVEKGVELEVEANRSYSVEWTD